MEGEQDINDVVNPGKSLKPWEIRLFFLEAPSGNSEEISCSLHTVNFKTDSPEYKALSYVCGRPHRAYHWEEGKVIPEPEKDTAEPETRSITCNGRPTDIPHNLFDFLSQVQKAGESGFFWADVLCIDQDDLDERACQVRMMFMIYQGAEEVLVWLGPEVTSTKATMEVLNEYFPALTDKAEARHLEGNDLGPNSLFDPTVVDDDVLDKFKQLAWFCWTCRWFYRVWTIQEWALSRQARFFSGEHEIAADTLLQLVLILSIFGWSPSIGRLVLVDTGLDIDWEAGVGRLPLYTWSLTGKLPGPPSLGRLTALIQEEGTDALLRDAHNVAHLLNNACVAQCKDARDKVYAMLGLVGAHVEDDSFEVLMPAVNYTLPVEQVYVHVNTRIMQQSRCLDILNYASRHGVHSSIHLPSWVPDYRIPPLAGSLWSTRALEQNPFDASQGVPHSNQILKLSDNKLYCDGLYFETVEKIAGALAYDHLDEDILKYVEFGVKSRASGVRSRYETFWRTCIADYPDEGPGVGREEDGHAFQDWIIDIAVGAVFRQALSPEQAQKFYSRLEATFREFKSSADYDHDDFVHRLAKWRAVMEEYLQYMLSEVEERQGLPPTLPNNRISRLFSSPLLTGRQLFLTQNGLLGLAAGNMEEGDQIWVLATASTPFLLRPVPNSRSKFWFVCDCFILDHMHGEIAAGIENVQDRVQEIAIV